jgi:dihydrofolate synthase/folylpolyglutamate synthase
MPRSVTDPLAYLFGLEQFGIKFGLENISTIVARMGHPERAFPTVHIAGTNGKGSVTAMVDAALRAGGRRSARYTSPHLVDITERFVVDGHAVSTEALTAVVGGIRDLVEQLRHEGALAVHPTFFEVTTAAAFELFRRARVDVAVIEVGLGGRLDATNVVSPIATAITSIAFDHQKYLGPTLRDIAIEKAGIIKPGVPVVVGPLEADASAAIAEVARERGATIVHASAEDVRGMAVGLPGAHQRTNAGVARRLLDVLDGSGLAVAQEAVASGIATPSWPGRLDLRRLPDGREMLLDAAHNPAGAVALASYLRETFETPPPLVIAAMRDKDITGMLRVLLPVIGRLVVTRASNPRSEDHNAIAARARALMPTLSITAEPDIAKALAAAWLTAPRIVVAGSIFLLGDVLRETEKNSGSVRLQPDPTRSA